MMMDITVEYKAVEGGWRLGYKFEGNHMVNTYPTLAELLASFKDTLEAVPNENYMTDEGYPLRIDNYRDLI